MGNIHNSRSIEIKSCLVVFRDWGKRRGENDTDGYRVSIYLEIEDVLKLNIVMVTQVIPLYSTSLHGLP